MSWKMRLMSPAIIRWGAMLPVVCPNIWHVGSEVQYDGEVQR